MVCTICDKRIIPSESYKTESGEDVHDSCYQELQDKLAALANAPVVEETPIVVDEQEKLFTKIRGLLRQAENTPYEEEANSFIRKAQELMLRYQIDEEALWASDPNRRQKVEQTNFKIADKTPGAQYRRIILSQIAQVSSCRMWYTEGSANSTVAGFPVDLVWVDMLFTSILTQANFKMAMAQAIQTGNARTFRTNWWAGYCSQISKRINETYAQARADVETSTGASTDLMIRDRRMKVDDYVNSKVSLRSTSYRDSSRYDAGARAAGKQAADTTDISGGRRSVSKPKGSLSA